MEGGLLVGFRLHQMDQTLFCRRSVLVSLDKDPVVQYRFLPDYFKKYRGLLGWHKKEIDFLAYDDLKNLEEKLQESYDEQITNLPEKQLLLLAIISLFESRSSAFIVQSG